jgi:putative DNA primase/helicase
MSILDNLAPSNGAIASFIVNDCDTRPFEELTLHALAYARRGWYVFPIYEPNGNVCACGDTECGRNAGKHPRTTHGLLDATIDEGQIREWWDRWPFANIGVATEPSRLFVLDFDKRHGGLESLRRLVAEHGDFNTRGALSGGGGEHLFFRATIEAASRSNVFKEYPGIDVRAKGGYIIAPPSKHIDGLWYAWNSGTPDEPADVPDWLAAMLGPVKRAVDFTPGATIGEGNRNSFLTSIAGSMRRRGLTGNEIEGALIVANRERLTVPLPDKEVSTIAKSVARYAPGNPIATDAPIDLRFHTEADAAQVLVEQFGADIRYCGKAGGWHLWDGKRWKRDEDDAGILRLAESCTLKIADAASTIADLDERKRLLAFAITLRKRRTLENLVALSRRNQMVAIGDPETFDADGWLLNIANGTVDLRTGELLSHDRRNLLTNIVDIDYDPEATCPRWERFLDEIFAGSTETIDFVQRAIGYSLTGSNREHAIFVLWGAGANGKSTLLSILADVLGDYGLTAAPSTFMERQAGGATNDLAALRGARFVSTIETGERASLAENFVKAVTGGDRISARYLYQEYFSFEPVFKVFLATNHKPVIKGTDEGIWRRIRLIPFTQRFEGANDDHALRQKLEAELPGILAWAVRGCLAWQARGLTPPATVKNATATYRTEMDTFAGFLETCDLDDTATVGATELYQSYRAWAEGSGERPVSQRWFGLRLGERGFAKKEVNGRGVWCGIRPAGRP